MAELEQQLAAQEAKYSEANTTLEAELERLRADGFEQVNIKSLFDWCYIIY